MLREAIALGVDHIDTSDYYGPHVTNELIREALYPYPGQSDAGDQDRRLARREGRLDSRITAPISCARSVEDGTGAAAARPDGHRQSADGWAGGRYRRADAGHAQDAGRRADRPYRRQHGRRWRSCRRPGPSRRWCACRTTTIWCIATDDAMIDALAADGIAYVPYFPLGGFTPLQNDGLNHGGRGSRANRCRAWRWRGCCSAARTSC